MFGPKLNTVFRSRWKALWWAAGIMLTAYCSVPDENGDSGSGKLLEAATGMQGGSKAEAKHANPWALRAGGDAAGQETDAQREAAQSMQNAAKVSDVLHGTSPE